MVLNRVRVTSDENIVTNARIELRGPDDEWVDISRCVQEVDVQLRVGEVSRTSLDLILTDALIEAGFLDERTLKAFAACLRLRGWAVMEPGDDG